MPHLAGYLNLTSSDGRCFELVNGCRTIGNLEAGQKTGRYAGWELRDHPNEWDGCCCWAFDTGPYGDSSGNPDPWTDPYDQETGRVAGFLPDAPGDGLGVHIESPLESDIVAGGTPRARRLTLTGTLVADSEAGVQRWMDWASRELLRCSGAMTATVFTGCPCADDLVVWGEDGPPPIEVDQPGYDGVCDPSPELLTAQDEEDQVLAVETHRRSLLKVRFRGWEELSDQPIFPGCYGLRIRLNFEVFSNRSFGPVQPLVTLGGSDVWDLCDCMTECWTIAQAGTNAAPSCNPLAQTAGTKRRRVTSSSIQAATDPFIRPKCFMRQAILTPTLPTSQQARLMVELVTGETVRNARLTIWPAYVGLPNPASDLGRRQYQQIEPAAVIELAEIRGGDIVTVDGMTSRINVQCPTGETYQQADSWNSPTLACDSPYWVTLDLSCDERSRGDMSLEASVGVVVESTST